MIQVLVPEHSTSIASGNWRITDGTLDLLIDILYKCFLFSYKNKAFETNQFKHANSSTPMHSMITSTSGNRNEPLKVMNIDDKMIHIQQIYSTLERTIIDLRCAFSSHLVLILIVKFTALTSLLYFCCMLIIQYNQVPIQFY